MIPLRDENPTSRQPIFTVAFIVINCLVFFYEYSLGTQGFTQFTYKFGLIPAELMAGRDLMSPQMSHLSTSPFLNLFSSMFMHGGIMHLGGNMLYLWIFGNNIEDELGHIWFILFYLASGIAAALTFALINPNSNIPMVGASGAISGILGAYILRYPFARVQTLVIFFFFLRIIRLPAVVLLGFWFILQLISGSSAMSTSSSGGVAWFAHIGGFIFGAAVFLILGKRYKKRRYYVA